MVMVIWHAVRRVWRNLVGRLSSELSLAGLAALVLIQVSSVAQAGCISGRCQSPKLVLTQPALNASYRVNENITVTGRAYGNVVYDSVGDEHFFHVQRVEIYKNGVVVGNATLGESGFDANDIPYSDFSYTLVGGFSVAGANQIGAKPYDTGSNSGAAAGSVDNRAVNIVANTSTDVSSIAAINAIFSILFDDDASASPPPPSGGTGGTGGSGGTVDPADTVGTPGGTNISAVPLPVAVTPPHLNNDIGGTLPGELDVNSGGAATYSIGLIVPPGTAGLQPGLALSYNSQGTNGLLGVGWSLGGLSSIHRCGKTFAQDGVNERIGFGSTDRLCLDGQRLVLVNLPLSDANYWASNAEYRTEIDSFSRISRFGNGFKVEAKDGRIMTYGIKPDGSPSGSRVAAVVGPITAGTAVCGSGTITCTPAAKPDALSWSIDSIKDRSGNFISYEYEQDMSSGEHKVSTIRYGGNGLPPHAAIKFTYDDRQDSWKRYVDQARNDLRKRISKIATYVGTDLSGEVTTGSWVREYSMSYDYSPTSGRSMLSSVTVCGRNVTTNASQCLPATKFDWGKPAPGAVAGFAKVKTLDSSQVPTLTTHNTDSAYHADYFAMSDFENHGYTDILEKRVADMSTGSSEPTAKNPIPAGTLRTSYRYFHNRGAAQFDQYSYRISTKEPFAVLELGDFDGDGAPDLIVAVPDPASAGGTKARICLSPLGRPGGLGAPGGMITFDCNNGLAAVGSNNSVGMPFVIDVKGNGKAAHYSKAYRSATTGRYVATLCIDNVCAEDTSPPVSALGSSEQEPGAGIQAPQNFTSFEQTVDFAGTGKPAVVLWPRPIYVGWTSDGDSGPIFINRWYNVTPSVLVPGFKPGIGSTANDGGLKSYLYAPRASNCTAANDCTRPNPYDFDVPSYSTGVAADFNGSGYSGVIFGYTITNVYGSGPTAVFDTAETTLCLSTGRELDCSVRRKYSGAGIYQGIRAVGNFVGDGMPGILVEKLATAGINPIGTGELQMCRLYGDDTTGGAGTNDANMVCSPWAGMLPRQTSSATEDKVLFLDLLGTGRTQMVVYHPGRMTASGWLENGTWDIYAPTDVAAPGQALDRIHQVTNGFGSVSSVTYADGAATGLVSQSGSVAPTGTRHVTAGVGKFVRTLKRGNGVAGDHTVTYAYKDAQIDISGRGSLGFATVSSNDDLTGITTTINYRQDWPYTGTASSVVASAGGVNLTVTSNNYATQLIPQPNGMATQFVYLSSSSVQRSDLDGSTMGCAQTSGVAYDNWGNLTTSTAVTSDAPCGANPAKTYTASTVNVYPPNVDKDHWLVAQLQSSTVTRWQSDGPKAIARATSYTYEDDYTGHVKSSKTSTPSSSALDVTTVFSRASNNFGLVNSKTVSWVDPIAGAASRTESTVYDGYGRYPTTAVNAVGHTESRGYDAGTGAATSMTDLNGLTTNFTNDGFGRVTSATRVADGNALYQYRQRCRTKDGGIDTKCPSNAAMAVVTEHFNGSSRTAVPSVTYSDSAGHPILAKTWGFDGKLIMAEQTYDDRSRTYSSSQPHFSAAQVFLAKTEVRDVLGRVTSLITKDEKGNEITTRTEYKGFERDMTNARGYPRYEYRDALGRLTKVVDAKNGITRFEYDAFDNLVKTTEPDTNVIVVGYDDMGHRTSMLDPDLGLVTYLVDPIGQVRQQQSPEQKKKGVYSTMTYDPIGRMTDRVGAGEDAHWVFDIGTGAKGQLTEAYTLLNGLKDYDRSHSFDNLGRPVTTSTKLYDALYTSTIGYDNWSRATSTTYQRGSDAVKRYDHLYNASGYLAQLETGGQRLWTVTSQDAALRVRATSLGNGNSTTRDYNDFTAFLNRAMVVNGSNTSLLTLGYERDAIGDVTVRSQYWNGGSGFTETITYDALNRIETSEVSGLAKQYFTYTAGGGILSKTGVGTGNFQYGAQGPDINGKNVARPHAVKSIDGLAGSFTYDDNGNMLSGRGRIVTWTLFDMPQAISNGTSSSTFAYGAERQRTRETRGDNSKIVFAGGQEIQLSSNDTLVSVKTYWPGGGGFDLDKPAQPTVRNWVHYDQLGSVVAMTDASGALKTGDELSYDVWGKRRAGNGAAPTEFSASTYAAGASDNKGFTGHEMLDQLDLVHMNGRVFDPFIGRFLSGDPMLQDPLNGQNYNRYTYVYNNPTNSTDPTGFCTDSQVEVTGSAQCFKSIDKAMSAAYGAGMTPSSIGAMAISAWNAGLPGVASNQTTNSSSGVGNASSKGQAEIGSTSGGGANRSANTTGPTSRDPEERKHRIEFMREGGGGMEGAASAEAAYQDWAVGKGYITRQEQSDGINARGVGALAGVGAVAGGYATIQAGAAVPGILARLSAFFTPQAVTIEGMTIYGSQNVLAKPGVVDQIRTAMLNGTYQFSSLAGRIGGEIRNGAYIIGEGHHRMAAAIQIYRSTGNPEFVRKLIEFGRFEATTTLRQTSMPPIPPMPR